MNIESALDALINLAIAYIILSITASAIVELLSQLLRVRGRVMGNTIRGLLGEYTQTFYDLPTITGLRQTGSLRTWLPFAMVGHWTRKPVTRLQETVSHKATADHSIDFIDSTVFAQAIATLDGKGKLPRGLKGKHAPFRYKGGALQLDQVRHWFEEAMKATKRQYRRSAQLALLLVGIGLAAAMELDSVQVLQQGFRPASSPAEPDVLGYLLTGAAISLGAQYWFDVVGKLLGLRSQATAAGLWGRAARKP